MKTMLIYRTMTRMAKRALPLCLFTLLPLCAAAQDIRPKRGNCTPYLQAEADSGVAEARTGRPRRLPSINRNMWDRLADKHSIVVLVEFNDLTFSMDDPKAYYERLFNERGYNERHGVGCVADYFRDQSDGRCDITFDVYGPVTVDEPSKASGNDFRTSTFRKVLLNVIDAEADDSTMGEGCDWSGDGMAQQVVFVYAGLGGNVDNGGEEKGCIWPHTATFQRVTLPNGLMVSNYTVSAERLTPKIRSGIGTICHEFSHSLGLPDIYPTTNTGEFSIVDEWDLMDGGNFSDNGWCPPNYSALEKMLLGWAQPVELSEAESITDMTSVAEGGKTYQVKKTNYEYYLLENRQWIGWDACLPGHGLAIFHVDYNLNDWSSNKVNNSPEHHGYDMFHADGLDYDYWDEIYHDQNPYVNHHSQYLSTSAYPYVYEDEVVNNELTDESVPAATTFAADGLMSKPITKISEDDYGLISFDFMGGYLSTIDWAPKTDSTPSAAYDLQGRKATQRRPGLLIQNGRKLIKR